MGVMSGVTRRLMAFWRQSRGGLRFLVPITQGGARQCHDRKTSCRLVVVGCVVEFLFSGLSGVGLFSGASRVWAGGFFVEAQGAQGIGRAHAGAAAAAKDVSTIFFNPAGLTELAGPEAAAAGHIVRPRANVKDRGSTTRTAGTNGAFVSLLGDDGDPFEPTPVPNVYFAIPLMNSRLWLGLGVTAPFGFVTDYSSDFFGRYDSTYTRLTTANIAPTVALRIRDWASVGAGLDIQYANGALENAIPDPLAPGGPTPGSDGHFRFEADDWSVGFNVGLLLKPLPTTRLGLHYRSAVEHDLKGDVTVSGLTGPLAQLNGTTRASAELNLPDILSFGVAHEVTPALTVLSQVSYFGWANFKQVRLRLVDESPDVVNLQNYSDSWAVAIGAEYKLTGALTFRTGFQYDETPTVDEFRTTRVPDADRYWTAVGVSYRVSNRFTLDAAYAHLFVEKAPIDLSRTFFEGTPLTSTMRMKGIAKGSIDILSAQLRVQF